MKLFTFILALAFMGTNANTSIHDFQINALDSDEVINFKSFAGKKILIVNVASKCGYTKQYKDLQALYEKYNDRLVIIGMPCNQFLGQESGTESAIAEFCSSQYGVTFPMTTKVDVKGKNQHPIYQWLTSKELNGKEDFSVSWNFNKFLIDENGQLIEYYPSVVNPLDAQIVRHLK